jgi:hypothetical protein
VTRPASRVVVVACRGLQFQDVVDALMRARFEGAVLRCARRAPIALVVAQGLACPYRFVCTRCGTLSGWFDWNAEGECKVLALGSTMPPPAPPPSRRRR